MANRKWKGSIGVSWVRLKGCKIMIKHNKDKNNGYDPPKKKKGEEEEEEKK